MSAPFPKVIPQWHYETPPRAKGSPGPAGQLLVVVTSTTASYVNLRALTFGEVYNATDADAQYGTGAPAEGPGGVVGAFITIRAETSDVGYITGPTAASVSGTNAPSLTAAGTLSGGVYTAATGTCHRIVAGQEKRIRLQVGRDEFLGFVGSAAGVMRLYQSSASGLQS